MPEEFGYNIFRWYKPRWRETYLFGIEVYVPVLLVPRESLFEIGQVHQLYKYTRGVVGKFSFSKWNSFSSAVGEFGEFQLLETYYVTGSGYVIEIDQGRQVINLLKRF